MSSSLNTQYGGLNAFGCVSSYPMMIVPPWQAMAYPGTPTHPTPPPPPLGVLQAQNPTPYFLHTPFDDFFSRTHGGLITPSTTFQVMSMSMPTSNSFHTTSFHSPRFNLYDNTVEYKIQIDLDGLDLQSDDIQIWIDEKSFDAGGEQSWLPNSSSSSSNVDGKWRNGGDVDTMAAAWPRNVANQHSDLIASHVADEVAANSRGGRGGGGGIDKSTGTPTHFGDANILHVRAVHKVHEIKKDHHVSEQHYHDRRPNSHCGYDDYDDVVISDNGGGVDDCIDDGTSFMNSCTQADADDDDADGPDNGSRCCCSDEDEVSSSPSSLSSTASSYFEYRLQLSPDVDIYNFSAKIELHVLTVSAPKIAHSTATATVRN